MPARGERAAPTFDQSRPQELPRFFEDLEYLLDRAGIAADADKKRQILRYVDFETERIWKALPEYKAVAKTYLEFKEAILSYYPDATGDYIYSLRDMDILIGERQRLGIATINELNAYHMQFTAITSWLIEKTQLSNLEQQRAYVRAFQPQLLASINNRLQLKNPDHHPSVPYNVKDVYDAARFILQGVTTTSSTFYSPPTISTAQTSQPPIAEASIKKEDLASFLTEFTKTIVGALNQSQSQGASGRAANNFIRNLLCLMCSGQHLVSACPVVLEYIKAGKCRRNQEGKVVLSTGAYVPREIPGKNLQERMDEWHKRNPNQLATATLFNAVDLRTSEAITLTSPDSSAYQLTKDDRIASLQAELYHLRSKKPTNPNTSAVRTRAQKAKITTVEDDDEAAVAAARSSRATIEEVIEEPTNQAPQPQANQEHPFRGAKDASYIPAINKPINTPVTAPQTYQRKQEAAYRTLPPIHDAAIATDVFKRSMELPITLTQRELLSLSPEVRSQVRDATTTKRVQNKDAPVAQTMLDIDDYDDYHLEIPIVPTFAVPNLCHRTPPVGATVIPDEYDIYYRSLRPGQAPDPDRLIVATDSVAIRSIHALVDNSLKKECILDPGCQIIAMSEHTCHDLGLAYDPAIRLNMQSANGEVNQSLGLARNVPFLIGTITFYLQVHVIQSPAYDILLGRPFDILTESIVRNFANEDQTITIRDPNTERRITIPTFSRTHRCTHKRQDF